MPCCFTGTPFCCGRITSTLRARSSQRNNQPRGRMRFLRFRFVFIPGATWPLGFSPWGRNARRGRKRRRTRRRRRIPLPYPPQEGARLEEGCFFLVWFRFAFIPGATWPLGFSPWDRNAGRGRRRSSSRKRRIPPSLPPRKDDFYGLLLSQGPLGPWDFRPGGN